VLRLLTAEGEVVELSAPGFDGPGQVVARAPRPALSAWSTDGSTLAVMSEGDLRILDLLHGRATRLAAPLVGSNGLTLAPDGRLLAIGDRRGALHVYDTQTGAQRTLVGHTRGINTVALSPRGRYAASSSENELLLWDLETGRRRALFGHAEWINALTFTADGEHLLSGGTDGTVRLWSSELADALPASPAEVARRLDRATAATLGEDDELAVGAPLAR
jgi:WD40 repeat protein